MMASTFNTCNIQDNILNIINIDLEISIKFKYFPELECRENMKSIFIRIK